MAHLAVKVAGLRFPNPILCGSGPLSETSQGIREVALHGAGGVVTRTWLAEPFAPAPEPSMVTYGKDGLLTCQRGAPRPLSEPFPGISVPVIASLAAPADQVGALGQKLVAAGADALEFATAFLPWPQAVEALQALRRAVSIPVIAKLSLWHGEDIGDRALAVEPIVDAFTCMSGFGPVLDIDVEKRGAPRLGDPYGYGWLSGAPIHPIAVRSVFEVARRVKKPVIASGGAVTARDVVEFLQVGASLVQVTTAAIVRGPAVFGRLPGDLDEWLSVRGYASVADVQGAYLKRFGQGQRVVLQAEEAPVLDAERCNKCGICGQVCWYGAMHAPVRKLPVVTAELCFQCGLCVSACPDQALSFRPRADVTMLR